MLDSGCVVPLGMTIVPPQQGSCELEFAESQACVGIWQGNSQMHEEVLCGIANAGAAC